MQYCTYCWQEWNWYGNPTVDFPFVRPNWSPRAVTVHLNSICAFYQCHALCIPVCQCEMNLSLWVERWHLGKVRLCGLHNSVSNSGLPCSSGACYAANATNANAYAPKVLPWPGTQVSARVVVCLCIRKTCELIIIWLTHVGLVKESNPVLGVRCQPGSVSRNSRLWGRKLTSGLWIQSRQTLQYNPGGDPK